ncbi:MAG: hypothetical protein Q8P49_00545 [Candidatus Liptonbacteria bacterium]|nr:hypothetical protein [Candidatus Liptonbacteria bacterium]
MKTGQGCSGFLLPRDGVARARARLTLGALRACATPSGGENLRLVHADFRETTSMLSHVILAEARISLLS